MARKQDPASLSIEDWAVAHSDTSRESWQMSKSELAMSRENMDVSFGEIHTWMENGTRNAHTEHRSNHRSSLLEAAVLGTILYLLFRRIRN